MDLLKRACLYLIRKKGKTVTLLAFLLVMATLMLTCFSIQSATETANANIKKALLGYFTINAKHLNTGITEDTLNQILSINGLSENYTLRSYSYSNYYDEDGKPLEINTEVAIQPSDGYENAGKIIANSNSEDDGYFTVGGFKLITGNAITSESKNAVLLHETFARRNRLSIGDTIQLGSIMDKTKTVEVTVAGIFTNTKEQDTIGIAPSCDLYENTVFTDLSTASYLLYGTDGKMSVQYGDFYVNDPDNLDRIMSDVRAISSVEWDKCTLTRYDKDYQNAKESLEGLQSIVFIAITAVSIISFLVLTLFLTLRLRGRIYETGIYLAIGITKKAVLAQYLLEVLMISIIALFLAYGTSSVISDQIGSRLLSQITTETYETVDLTDEAENTEKTAEKLGLSEIVVNISAENYALVWVVGIMLCLLSTAFAAYPIMKMKPKNIFSQMS